MRATLDCYPCFVRQALTAARLTDADERKQRAVVERALRLLLEMGEDVQPPEVGGRIYRTACEELGDADPYGVAREMSTERALALYDRLRMLVAESDAPLEAALKISIAGNTLDFGVDGHDALADLWEHVRAQSSSVYGVDDSLALIESLDAVDHVLFLADNAGETVFDRVLIETLEERFSLSVTYAVKSGRALNDATRHDALAAGVDGVAEIIENGAAFQGTMLSLCSDDFLARFWGAELIVAKGQANYETLDDSGAPIFFMLQVKCDVIARDLGVPVGSMVIKQGDASR